MLVRCLRWFRHNNKASILADLNVSKRPGTLKLVATWQSLIQHGKIMGRPENWE